MLLSVLIPLKCEFIIPMCLMKLLNNRCETNCTAFPDTCISANLYMAMADQMAADGYAAVGYEYVNVSDASSCVLFYSLTMAAIMS